MGITLNNYMNTTSVSNLTSLYEKDTNYMVESIRFINDLNKDYYRERSNFIKSIYESGNDEKLILESFEGFFGNIKKIIDKFLDFIKKLFEQFTVQLAKFISSDKFIKKNKDALHKFSSENEFNYTGFVYTFDKDIPLIFAESEFKMDFENILNPDYLIQSNRDALKIKLKDGYYDKFRAEVLCRQNEIIYEEAFEKELFEEYRDNTSDKDPIVINKGIVDICLYRFLNYSDLEKQVKETKSDIEKQYNNIKNFIKNDFNTSERRQELINRFNDEYSKTNNKISIKEIDEQFNLLMSMKTDQVMKMSNIHALAFGAKLEAMKSCLKQDRDILYNALNQLAKKGSLKENSNIDQPIWENDNIVHEFLFNNNKPSDMERYQYLKHVSKDYITSENFKKKIYPKMVDLHKKISEKCRNKFKNNIDLLVDNPGYYAEFKQSLINFSKLQSKEYDAIMKQLAILIVEMPGMKDSINVFLNDLIKNENEFAISWTDNMAYLVCQEWIYDKNIVEQELGKLEAILKQRGEL